MEWTVEKLQEVLDDLDAGYSEMYDALTGAIQMLGGNEVTVGPTIVGFDQAHRAYRARLEAESKPWVDHINKKLLEQNPKDESTWSIEVDIQRFPDDYKRFNFRRDAMLHAVEQFKENWNTGVRAANSNRYVQIGNRNYSRFFVSMEHVAKSNG